MQSGPGGNYYQPQCYPPTNPGYNPSLGFGFTGAPSGYPPPQVGGYNYASVAGGSYAQASVSGYVLLHSTLLHITFWHSNSTYILDILATQDVH